MVRKIRVTVHRRRSPVLLAACPVTVITLIAGFLFFGQSGQLDPDRLNKCFGKVRGLLVFPIRSTWRFSIRSGLSGLEVGHPLLRQGHFTLS